jgi:hypothetical protein
MRSSSSEARRLYTGRDPRHFPSSYERRRPESTRFSIQSPLPLGGKSSKRSEDSCHVDMIMRFFSNEKFASNVRSFSLAEPFDTFLCHSYDSRFDSSEYRYRRFARCEADTRYDFMLRRWRCATPPTVVTPVYKRYTYA